MLIHSNERPFPCPIGCGLSFRTKGNMQDHHRRHSGLRPFVCPCGAGYYRKHTLVKHKETCMNYLQSNIDPMNTPNALEEEVEVEIETK